MGRNLILQFLTRTYGWLIRLYPNEYRERFGSEIEQVFQTFVSEAQRKNGARAGLLAGLRLHMELLPNLLKEQVTQLRSGAMKITKKMALSATALFLIAAAALGYSAYKSNETAVTSAEVAQYGIEQVYSTHRAEMTGRCPPDHQMRILWWHMASELAMPSSVEVAFASAEASQYAPEIDAILYEYGATKQQATVEIICVPVANAN